MRNACNISAMPTMAAMCKTCPFGPNGSPELRARVSRQVLGEASQICHHPRTLTPARKETHLCRGARDLQLQAFHALGFIEAPTDEAWDAKRKELGI